MDAPKVKQLIKRGESQKLEFKASLSMRNEIGQTVSGFSNAEGGTFLIGVSPKGKIKGLDIGKKTVEKFANRIKENTDPQIYPDIKVHKIAGKSIIKATIKESDEKPVFFKDRAYQRVGKTNQRISANTIRNMAKQSKPRLHWDEMICERATMKDIDEEKVKWFLKKAKRERDLQINPDIPTKEALKRLDLTSNGDLTNAAVLLFGKNPQKFFFQAKTKCGRFKGTEALEFIDMKEFKGNIFDQREDAVEFVKEHIKLHAKVVEMERAEKWEYPIEAIREAITNAICHRDYEMSAHIQVRIFDDRLEIWGCGSLPEPLTVEDLKGEHRSVLRNHLIGKCFFLIKFIEEWGTGTNRIIKSCLEHGLPEPVFEERSGGLVVRLRKYKVTEEMLKELNERQKKAVEFIKQHKEITLGELKKICPEIAKRTLRKDLQDLVKFKLIKPIGEKRGRKYILK